ncbi:uncharacterized protein LOC114515673 [Dendronephthya gigantea]|uniref:uncharacterized protein LOC114515673 n=1 Tax=Dendronephthya gigantea TaxID=151771 RepID=UPI00106DD28E|nr:uncharacterized protein LOC114515673 [Dendronephthya gigantea]
MSARLRRIPGQVDLVFVMGCTESMRNIISDAAGILRRIAQGLRQLASSDVRIALVRYRGRDDPYQGNNYRLQSYRFSGNSHGWFNDRMYCGGTNSSDAMADGLNEVLRLSFRPTATKICFWIGDWNLQGNQDLSEICHQMVPREIVLHCIGCNQPNTADAESPWDFMGVTGGQYTSVEQISDILLVIFRLVQEEILIDNAIGHTPDFIMSERRNNPNVTESELAESLRDAVAELRNNNGQNWGLNNQQNLSVYTAAYPILHCPFPETIAELMKEPVVKQSHIESDGDWLLKLIRRILAVVSVVA